MPHSSAMAAGLTGLRPLSPTPRGCGHGEQEAGNTDMLILMLSVFFYKVETLQIPKQRQVKL